MCGSCRRLSGSCVLWTLLLCAAIALLFSGCNGGDPYMEGGVTRGSIVTTTAPSEHEHPDDPNTPVVYWVSNGSVYHASPVCSALAKSVNILSGSLDKCPINIDRPCSRCFSSVATTMTASVDSGNNDATSEITTAENFSNFGSTATAEDPATALETSRETTVRALDPDEIVYYTKSGTRFHINQNCSSLSNSSSVLSAKISECPQQTPCAICSKNVVPPSATTSETTDTAIQTTSQTTPTTIPPDSAEVGEPTVYYTSGGSVYHTYEDCYHIAASSNVLSCPLSECPKNSLCKDCAKRD